MSRTIRTLAVTILLVGAAGTLWAPGAGAQSPAQGPGGPVLIVTGPDLAEPAKAFGGYYAEILRAEGLNEFAVTDKANLNAATLANYQVVLLSSTSLTGAQASALTTWVEAGGNLIAMRPDTPLAGLLGLGADTGNLSDAYLKVNTGLAPGAGITSDTMQFHGTADVRSASDATPLATLYSDANTQSPAAAPAVTLRNVGSLGGQAAAFTYDLARSVVYTRQGNPAWAGDKRDGQIDPIRSDDLFFGAKVGDVRPDWVNLGKVAIPQADEQQRVLANLVTQMNLDRTPLPRFWYLPRGEKAAVVMTGDDHHNGGTSGRFDNFEAASPKNCSVADWQCVRATSYVFPPTTIPDAQAYQAKGFEIALHLNTGCDNFTPESLEDNWATQLGEFAALFPGLAAPQTNRTHCITWSDWAGEPKAELQHGVRLDTNYYYWPGAWVQNRPGLFTGSGFPMRFADTDGSLIDVYQAATQLTDESGIDIPAHIEALLDGALGADGYYGVITANMHTDLADSPGADAIVAEATSRNVPVISAEQLLTWIDGRDGSAFRSVAYAANNLTFTVSPGSGARNLQAMVPTHTTKGALIALTRGGSAVPTTIRTVKGIEYAFFDAVGGSYVATYDGPLDPGPDTTVPGSGSPAPSSSNQASSKPDAAISGGAGATGNRKAPRVTISRRTVRASRRGTVTVRVSCPRTEVHCQVELVLRRAGRRLAHRLVTVGGGKTAKVNVRLTRAARTELARAGSLRVDVVATATGAARSRAFTTTTRIRVLAPPRR